MKFFGKAWTPEMDQKVQELRASGMTFTAIGDKYGMHRNTVRDRLVRLKSAKIIPDAMDIQRTYSPDPARSTYRGDALPAFHPVMVNIFRENGLWMEDKVQAWAKTPENDAWTAC